MGRAALRVTEASVSDRQVLRVRAMADGTAEDAPASAEVALDGVALGRALRHEEAPGRFAYLFMKELGEENRPAAGSRVTMTPDGMAPAGAALNGRLGPAAPGWFADATWTASPDVLAALEDRRPAVLILADTVPEQGAQAWGPVANLAAALRLSGQRSVLLHYGLAADCESDAGEILRHVDVLHHHTLATPQRAWDPEAPGSPPAVDRSLPPAVAAIAAASAAATVIAASVTALGILGRLPAGLSRAALLPRSLVLAPRMIFAPIPREKAVVALGGLLARSTVIVEDEGLGLELSRWLPAARTAVLPPGSARAAPPTGPTGESGIAAPVAAPPTLRADPPPQFDAQGFASELGLAPASGTDAKMAPAFLRRLLALRLAGPDEREDVGLLVVPERKHAALLAAAFTALRGADRVFARHPTPAMPGVLPLSQAPGLGIRTVLMEVPEDRALAMAVMERVVNSGLSPLPLAPQAGWTDRAGLSRWRGARPGTTAYVGQGPLPVGADLLLVPGAAEVAGADAVELSGPDDPRRGALLTIFAANDDAFWRRPPAPALGYDRDDTVPGLEIEAGLAGAHPAEPMLALARQLGCARVLLPVALLQETALAPALQALEAAGVVVGPAR